MSFPSNLKRFSVRNFPLLRRLPLDDMHGLLRFAMRRLNEDRLPQVAGSLTFTTVLALVPTLTIALAVFTSFPIFNAFRSSLETYFIQSVMPKGIADTILGNLNQFASKATRLSAVGAVALILTTLIMMLTIDRAFNHIWRVKSARPLTQKLVVYWAIMTLGPLLIGVSITVTSYLFTATSGAMNARPLIGDFAYTVLSVMLTMGAYTLLYIVVPNRVVDWRDALWGGLFAAVAFEVAKRLFVVFVANFPTYTVIYGALAALPIFLLWIYVSWLITLMGAVLAAALPVVKYERWWHMATPGSEFMDAMTVLKVLYIARERGASAAVDTLTIRSTTRLGYDESEVLLDKMLNAGWVGRVKTEGRKRLQLGKRITDGLDAWTLLVNPEQIKVADVYRLFVFYSAGYAASDATLAKQVEEAVEQQLDQSIGGYFRSGKIACGT